MYLLVNCETGDVYQQTFAPTESQLDCPSLKFFMCGEQTYRGVPETIFDVSDCESLTGWDEIPVLDGFLESIKKEFPHLLAEERAKVGLE